MLYLYTIYYKVWENYAKNGFTASDPQTICKDIT